METNNQKNERENELELSIDETLSAEDSSSEEIFDFSEDVPATLDEHPETQISGSSQTKVAVLPKKIKEKYSTAKHDKKKKSWFEPAGYTETVSTVHNVLKTVVYIVSITVIAAFLAYFAITRINDLYAFVKADDEVEVTIPENATVNEITEILADAGVINYPSFFKFYAQLKDASNRYEFKAGTYTVNPMMNYDQLFETFMGVEAQKILRVTIPEGYTVDEIIDLFVSLGIGTKEGFENAIQNYDFDYDFMPELDGLDNTQRKYRLEGYLFPDTYEFYSDRAETYYLYRLLDRFDEVYSQTFKDRAAELGMTMDEVITLASLIEKEALFQNDFEIISSVFHNRLNNPAFETNGYLESDATVVYAYQILTGERLKEVTAEHLAINSPYNTHEYKGLPPGAICNPGYEAIACALYPESTKYYYFVSALSGETFYATNYSTHKSNVSKVQKLNAEYKEEHGID